jgi:hypothetical protein
MKVYTYNKTGTDGLLYGVRLLLDPDELTALQAVGLVPEVSETIALKWVADQTVAQMERNSLEPCQIM